MTDAAGFRELAMLASLAGRVERQLLRALRLELAPHLAAADEADLWFSPVVESASETGLVFKPAALPELQRLLAEDPYRRLEPAWNLMFRLRTGVDYAERGKLKHSTWLLVQEELTYWGVRGGATRDEDARRIATLCAWVVNSRADERLAQDAGSWLQAARLRLPAASWHLAGAEEMRAVAQSLSRSRMLFVRRVAEGVELSEQRLEAAHPISTSAPAGPLRVEVVPRGEGAGLPQAALVGPGVALVATAAPNVDLILADGQAFALDLIQARPHATDPAQLARRTVLVGLGRGHLNGVLLTSEFVLTCAHGASNWRQLDHVAIQLSVDLSDRGASSPRPTPARPVAWSPLKGPTPLPVPFGPQADDLALLRLDAPLGDALLAEPPMVDPARPVLGLEVTACLAQPGSESISRIRLLRGEVVEIDERGYIVDFQGDAPPEPGSSGAPVWLADGRLLGLVSGARADRRTLVTPVRSLASLVNEVPRRVLVVGSGGHDNLPAEVWQPAEALGRALARAGFVLVCGGWPGVDHIVARSFAASVGDEAALASRFTQLVESGSSPDFVSSVPPVFIGPDSWAAQMSASADALVALGGLGGTLKIGRVALGDGRITLPVPGTGGDAQTLYRAMHEEPDRRAFPDRRALRILEGDTANPDAAEIVADHVLELLDLCYDEAKLAIYRRTAAAVSWLLHPGLELKSGAIPYTAELNEAAGAFLSLEADGDPRSLLLATLPEGAPWLIRDLLRIEAEASSGGAEDARIALLDAILNDADATEKLARMLAAQPVSAGRELRTPSGWKDLASASETLRQKLDALDSRIAIFEQRRVSLSALRSLAAKFLAPVDMTTFNASYVELEREVGRRAATFDQDFAARLLTSAEAVDRVIGYVFFLKRPVAALLPTLPVSLRLERQEALERRETRPLWLVLECIMAVVDDGLLAPELPPMLDLASTLLRQLLERSDVDPGRECTRLLQQIALQLRVLETTERFATYSRFTGVSEGRRRFAWCAFVDAPHSRLDRISQVEYTLDPTFRRPVRLVRDAAHGFLLVSEGWGEFTLKIRIFYKSGRMSSQNHCLELKVDAWPPGPAYSGSRDEPATRLYAALSGPRWLWRTETALARETGMTPQGARAGLADLARGCFVRKSRQLSTKGKELWGATVRIGALPMPTGGHAGASPR